MKSQIKRFSKSTLSVILSLCMLVSCMTVGIIATDAAYDNSEGVGARSGYVITGSIDDWARSKTMTVSSGGYYCYYDLGSNTGSKTYDLAVVSSSSSWDRVISRNNTYAHPSDGYWSSGALTNGDSFWFWFDGSGDDNFHVQPKTTQSHVYVVVYYPNTELNQYNYAQVCCYTSLPNDTPKYSIKNNFAQSNGSSETFANTNLTASNTKISPTTTYTGTMTFSKASQNYRFQVVKELGSSYKSDGNAIKKYFGMNNATISQEYSEYNLYTENDYCKFASPELDATTASFTVTDSDWTDNIVCLSNTYPTVYTVSYTLGTNVSYSSVSGGTKTANGTIKAVSGSNVAITVTYDTNYTYDSSNSNLGGATASNSNKTFTFSNISSNKTISIAAKSSLEPLSAPTNVKLNDSAANSTVTATTVGAKIRLTWDSVTNAGSYKVYKDDALVDEVSTLYYDIERAYSSTGTYTVMAVPNDTNSYSESTKSTARTLTVNKKTLSTPTVTVTPTGIALGSSVNLTATDTNSGVTAAQYNLYYYETSLSATNDYLLTSGTAKSITPTTAGTHTYKVVAYPVNGADNDYYTQSSATSASTVTVYAPSWYLVGDLVDSGNDKWSTSNTNFPVDTYDSPNIFKRTVTYASGGTNDKHYFRLNNGTNQYTETSGSDTDMSTYTTSATAVTAGTATTNGSMYVTGQGTYTIYVDQSTSGSPKVWVVATTPQTYTTTVYVNQDSIATNLYVWKDGAGVYKAWPGESITGTTETVNDIPYYKYTFTGYLDHFSMIVNKGNDTNKSANITNKEGDKTYYVTWDGTHMSTPECSETAPYIQLGYKKGDNGTVNHLNFNNSRTVSVTLDANSTYNFWMKSANTHYNDENSGTMTRLNCTGWHFPNNDTDTKIQTDLAGTYTFTYTVTNGEFYVSVTYPPEPKYNVTVNQGDHGTVTVNGSSFTSGNTIQIGSLTTASIEAVPASGYHFTGWTTSGGVAAVSGYTTSSNPITISASAPGSITATYEENSYTLTLASAGNGSITTPASKTMTVHPYTATSLSGVTVTPDDGYKFSGWTAGTNVTLTDGSTSDPAAGTVKASQDSTLTATFTKVSYNLTGVVKLNGSTITETGTTVKFYSNPGCTTQITTAKIGDTVYAKFSSDTYSLVDFTLNGTGAVKGTRSGNILPFTMGYGNVTVTANVAPQPSVTYYIDMHDNKVDENALKVAVVSNGGGNDVLMDGNGNNCEADLEQQGSSTVYAASINTPLTNNGITLRVTYGATQKTVQINSTDAAALMNAESPEVWIEAQNEVGNKFKVTYATNTGTAVASGKKRIYVAKPYDWQDNDKSWEHLHLYHWGDYVDIGWNKAPQMTHIGNDSEYHYYYIDVDSNVNNIIFQGWKKDSSTPDVQTGNIENIGNSNYFILSKDGSSYLGTKGDNATVPSYTRYVQSVDMNVGENANIAPTTNAKVTYTCASSHISISEEGVVTANSSSFGESDVSITVKVFGSVGAKATSSNPGDYMEYTCTVSVRNPGVFNSYKIMSFAHQEYTVEIAAISNSNTQPGYFDLEKTSALVNGLYDGSTYTASYAKSAIITSKEKINDSDAGEVTTKFTVKYAASNSSMGYSNITINNATIVTKSIKHQGQKRYGFKEWNPAQSTATKATVIENGVETVTHKGISFSSGTSTYNAVFEEYDYVDVTFTFSYYEYNPELSEDGMINYPYESTWAGTETIGNTFNKKVFTVTELVDGTVKGSWAANGSAGASTPCVTLDVSAVSSSGGNWYAWTWGESDGRWITGNMNGNIITFADNDVDNNIIFVRMNAGDAMNWNNAQNKTADLSSRSHNLKTVTVSNYEVRNKTADTVEASDLVTPALKAIGVKPDSNYYSYSIAAANITISNRSSENYTASAAVNMSHSVKQYKVYVNGDPIKDSNNNPLTYTYQQYAEPSVQNPADWYAVDSSDQNASIENASLLATNVNSYKFRVKGSANSTNTYLRTIQASASPHGDDFLRSEVDFSHYEVTHQGSTPTSMKEYLMQNFYIADFFSPSEVLDPNSYSGKGKFGPAYKVEAVTESTSTSSGNITVHFTDSLDWNDIHIYYWGENINNDNWPGSVMTQSGTDEDGKKIYSAEIPGTAEGVIFTGNNNQTVDITNNIANGSHWKSKNETVQNGIPYDDAQFVGGGVVYYSMNGATENNQGTPFANAVSSGYVGNDGKINANAIKEMLKSNIEAQYAKDNIAGTVGEEDAMKIAYGTEIAATKNKEGGFNTGIIYRYLPLNQYKRDGNGTLLAPDQDGNYAYDVNTNTFRYSNSLQSYQYVYASGNENKETNTGKNMRLYSYFVYSYTAYNQETNVPETKYEIVLSDNYSDASTYWNGNTGN